VSARRAKSTLDTARELQRSLYRAAKASPTRRFHALYDKMYRKDVLVTGDRASTSWGFTAARWNPGNTVGSATCNAGRGGERCSASVTRSKPSPLPVTGSRNPLGRSWPKSTRRCAALGARVHSSGEEHYGGRITKQGRRDIRCTMVESAWVAVGGHPYWKELFERLAVRVGRPKAIVAIARKLLVVVWHVLARQVADREAVAEQVAGKFLEWSWNWAV
jgi:hypothetical protein